MSAPTGMSRWKPDARSRLAPAALQLYGERGFEQTTVAEIAQRAGLTERAFVRHFADKRAVLFGGTMSLQDILVSAVASAPDSAAPLDAVAAALDAVAASGLFPAERRDDIRLRQAIIDTTMGLQERELIRFAALAAALAGGLRGRGVREPAASLAAEAGIVVFKVAFGRWVSDDNHRDLSHLIRDSLEALEAVTAGA